MTVFCTNSSTTYADIAAADAAESGIDYGIPTRFEQTGDSSASVVFSDANYPSGIIYTATIGEETDGTTSVGAQCTGLIQTSVVSGLISNLRTGRIIFSNALNHHNENLVSDGGGGDAYIFGTNAASSTNCIRYNCSEGVRANAINDNYIETNCTVVDASGFGVLRPRAVDSVSLNTASSAYLQVGATSSNYWADDGTGSDAITEATKTDIFENYAIGDYRIKPTSSVGVAGAGAFINSGGVTSIEVTPSSTQSNSSVGNPTLVATSEVLIGGIQTNSSSSAGSPVIELSVPISISPNTTQSSSEAVLAALVLNYTIELNPLETSTEASTDKPTVALASNVNVNPTTGNSESSTLSPEVNLVVKVSVTPNPASGNSGTLNPDIVLGSILSILAKAANSNSNLEYPQLDLTSLVELASATTNSTSVIDNPTVLLSTPLLIAPVTTDSESSSEKSTITLLDSVNVNTSTTESYSGVVNPDVSTTSRIELIPNNTQVESSTDNASILLASSLSITPSVVSGESTTPNPTINLVTELIISGVTTSSVSGSERPNILVGQKLTIESFTIKYIKPEITASYSGGTITSSYGE